MTGNGADGVGAGVDDIASGIQFANPCGLKEVVGLHVAQLNDIARHSPGAVKRGQGDVHLLETTAEDDCESSSEGFEESVPLGPGIDRVLGCAFVEVANGRFDLSDVDRATGEKG